MQAFINGFSKQIYKHNVCLASKHQAPPAVFLVGFILSSSGNASSEECSHSTGSSLF